jgi:hypothetical protein
MKYIQLKNGCNNDDVAKIIGVECALKNESIAGLICTLNLT